MVGDGLAASNARSRALSGPLDGGLQSKLERGGAGQLEHAQLPPRAHPAQRTCAIAQFSGTASGALTVSLGTAETVGSIVLGNSAGSSTNYTLSGGTLTMNNIGSPSAVLVLGGSHAILAPVYISGDGLGIIVSNSGTLAIPGNITDDNGQESLTLSSLDGSGQLILSGSNSYGGGTIVQSGTLSVQNIAGCCPTGRA